MIYEQKDIALAILKLEHKFHILSDDLFDFKMELDKIKSSILDDNIFIHVNTNNNSYDSDNNMEYQTFGSFDNTKKHKKIHAHIAKRRDKSKTKSKST